MFRAPSQAGLPPLRILIDDIPSSTAQVARHLSISLTTLKRYLAAEQAPRTVMLALFWESRWGRSFSNVDADNAASLQFQRAASLERENIALRRQIRALEAVLAHGPGQAANAPFFRTGS